MTGDLSHSFGIKIGKECLEDDVIFNKVDTTWGEYDINDFDIKQINTNIYIYM